MSELSRPQLAVYAAIAVALLLLGDRWLRSDDQQASDFGGVAQASSSSSSFDIDRGGGSMVVHVAGEVRKPGVYELPAGSRVTDAVDRAGGVSPSGAPDSINLAAKLADGQQVVLPGRTSGPAGAPAGTTSAIDASSSGPISLGSATLEQLDTVEGIGPVTAQDILAYRDEHGGISSVEDLDEISGIGPATMQSLRDRVQP